VTRTLALALLIALIAASLVQARTVRFTIDAQYRGGVSLDFGTIGDTTLSFMPSPDGGVHVTGSGLVHHPREKEKIYSFGIDMAFRVEGNWIRVTSTKSTSNEMGKELMGKIEHILPLLHVAANFPSGEVPIERHFYSKRGVLGVTSSRKGGAVEVAVMDGPKPVATFWLHRGADGITALDRFRVNTSDGVMLGFTADRPLAFAGDWSHGE
jgi:hypothetical protein